VCQRRIFQFKKKINNQYTMDQNNTPDAWDQGDDVGAGDTENKTNLADDMAKLNVNAAPFIPGQNVYAKEFTMPGIAPPVQNTVQAVG
jgi:hypothetical protein